MCVCVSVWGFMHVSRSSQRPAGGVQFSLELEWTGGCELLRRCWESNSDHLEEQRIYALNSRAISPAGPLFLKRNSSLLFLPRNVIFINVSISSKHVRMETSPLTTKFRLKSRPPTPAPPAPVVHPSFVFNSSSISFQQCCLWYFRPSCKLPKILSITRQDTKNFSRQKVHKARLGMQPSS